MDSKKYLSRQDCKDKVALRHNYVDFQDAVEILSLVKDGVKLIMILSDKASDMYANQFKEK